MSGLASIKEKLGQKAKLQEQVYVYLPNLSSFAAKEIEFHDQIIPFEKDLHQLETLRNQFYHNYFKKWLFALPKQAVVLEVGSGSGYDLTPILQKGYQLIASDLSFESVKFIKKQIDLQFPEANDKVCFLVADAAKLPLADQSIEAVFMAAALHHFVDQSAALNELSRVVKKNGLIIAAMEPSRLMMRLTKIFSRQIRLKLFTTSSIADQEHHGYLKRDFKNLASQANLRLVKIKRVWLTLGLIHYFLEFLFRIFKLRKRIKLPKIIEAVFLVIDEILLKIPIINWLNWHWIIVLKKVG